MILEEEQHRRMVEAYRAELYQVTEWLGKKKLEGSPSQSKSSSQSNINKQLDRCKSTVFDIERKLKMLSELSS